MRDLNRHHVCSKALRRAASDQSKWVWRRRTSTVTFSSICKWATRPSWSSRRTSRRGRRDARSCYLGRSSLNSPPRTRKRWKSSGRRRSWKRSKKRLIRNAVKDLKPSWSLTIRSQSTWWSKLENLSHSQPWIWTNWKASLSRPKLATNSSHSSFHHQWGSKWIVLSQTIESLQIR